MHKTATTHLQHSLGGSSEALVAAGVRYYGPDYLRLRGRTVQKMFGLGHGTVPRRSAADQIAFLVKDGHRVVLSEENVSGQLIAEAGALAQPLYATAGGTVAELAEKLSAEGIPLDLFVSLRSPASFVTSCYSQALLAGKFPAPTEFAALNRPTSIDWTGLIGSLASIPGVRALHVWRYEDYRQVLPALLDKMVGPQAARGVELAKGMLNQGLSARALDQLLEARENGNGWLTPARARKRFPVGPDAPPFGLFGPSELANDNERYAAQITRIAAMPGVTMIVPRGQG